MAPHFVFPPNLQALEKVEEQEDCQDNRLFVQSAIEVSKLRPSELEEFVKGVSFDLSDKELYCIEEQDVFDRVYSSVRGFSSLTPSCKFILAESLRSNLSVLLPNVDSLVRVSQAQEDDEIQMIDRVTSYRNAFKIYSFFLLHIILTEESNTSSSNNAKGVIPIPCMIYEYLLNMGAGHILRKMKSKIDIGPSLPYSIG